MLISKTVCPVGSLVYIVPTGLQLVLHYDARGNLRRVYQGFEHRVDLGEDFLKLLVTNRYVPNAIKLTGGITDVWGVIYSDSISCDFGMLPECEYDNIKSMISSGDTNLKFYVGCVDTGAAAMNDPTSMITWASMCGFNTLPLWVVPEDPDDQKLQHYLSLNNYPFKYPFIGGYLIYEKTNKPYYHSVDLKVAKVIDAQKTTESNGCITYGVVYGNTSLTMTYPDAVKYNVQPNSYVLLDRMNIIWCSTQVSTVTHRLSKRITCDFCGKILDVPESGIMTCTDDACLSLIYPRITYFCKCLDMLVLPYSTILEHINQHRLQTFTDLLLLPEYVNNKIHAPLWKILHAVIPGEIGVSSEWLTRLCNKCNNDYKTLNYYLHGPRRIVTELNLEVSSRFVRWISAPEHLLEIDTILNSPQLVLEDTGKLSKFDAPLLLLHKTIFITGTFKHGTHIDITTILRSYGANVVTAYDEFVDYVLVGDIKDEIDGSAILGARALHIPVVDESAFFAHYGIDADLANNLV